MITKPCPNFLRKLEVHLFASHMIEISDFGHLAKITLGKTLDFCQI